MSERICDGNRVLLYQDSRRKWVAMVSKTKFHTHRGFVNLEELVGKRYGEPIRTSLGQTLWTFKPRAVDVVEAFDRPTQILYPKDIGYALYQLDVKSGDRVLEVGAGSGAMTSALARAVEPGGHVFSYEMRSDFLEVARRNVERADLSSHVTFHNKDPSGEFDERDVDVVVLDLGDPWKITGAAWKALAGGGMLAGFTPTFNQLERLAESLRKEGFLVLEAVEVLTRQLKTEAGKLRPESRMVGHTAYITIARKVLSSEGEVVP